MKDLEEANKVIMEEDKKDQGLDSIEEGNRKPEGDKDHNEMDKYDEEWKEQDNEDGKKKAASSTTDGDNEGEGKPFQGSSGVNIFRELIGKAVECVDRYSDLWNTWKSDLKGLEADKNQMSEIISSMLLFDYDVHNEDVIKELSAVKAFWLVIVALKDLSVGADEKWNKEMIGDKHPNVVLQPMSQVMARTTRLDERMRIRQAQLNFFRENLWDCFLEKTERNKKKRKCVTVTKGALLAVAGYKHKLCPSGRQEFASHAVFVDPLEPLKPLKELANSFAKMADLGRKNDDGNVLSLANAQLAAIKCFSNGEDSDEDVQDGLCVSPKKKQMTLSLWRDRSGKICSQDVKPMPFEKYWLQGFGNDGKKLVNACNELLGFGRYLDFLLDVHVAKDGAEDRPEEGEMRVVHERLYNKNKYAGDVVVLKNVLSEKFAEDVFSSANSSRFIEGSKIKGSNEKRRPVRVSVSSYQKGEGAHFKVNSDRKPIASVLNASVGDRLCMDVVTFLMRHLEKKLIQPQCGEGEHYCSWVREFVMNYTQINRAQDSNGAHTDKGPLHTHDRWRQSDNEQSAELPTLKRGDGIGSHHEVFLQPPSYLMNVPTVVLAKDRSLKKIVKLLHFAADGKKHVTKPLGKGLFVGGRDIHLQFFCQDSTKHNIVAEPKYRSVARYVCTVRMALIPGVHGEDVFNDYKSRNRILSDVHNDYGMKKTWSLINGEVLDGGRQSPDKHEPDSKPGSRKSERQREQLVLPKFLSSKAEFLTARFKQNPKNEVDIMWRYMVQGPLLEMLISNDNGKNPLFVTVVDREEGASEDPAEHRDRHQKEKANKFAKFILLLLKQNTEQDL